MNNKSNSRACAFCPTIDSKYSCPRCGRFYCGSACYKSNDHLECSENFYRNCVMDTLRCQSKANDLSLRKKTVDILRREFEQLSQEPDEAIATEQEDDNIDQLISNLMLNSKNEDNDDEQQLWNSLTDHQKQEFNQLLRSKAILNLVPPHEFQPWYVLTSCEPLIQPVDPVASTSTAATSNSPGNLEEDDLDEDIILHLNQKFADQSRRVPARFKNIKSLKELLGSKAPADCICYSMLQTLFTYCFVSRRFGNDWCWQSNEAIQLLLQLNSFHTPRVFRDTDEALQHCIQALINDQHLDLASISLLFDDLLLLVEDVGNQKLYLNCICDMIQKVRHDIVRQKSKSKKLLLAEKRLIFFLSWANEHGIRLRDEINAIRLIQVSIRHQIREHETKEKNSEIKIKYS